MFFKTLSQTPASFKTNTRGRTCRGEGAVLRAGGLESRGSPKQSQNGVQAKCKETRKVKQGKSRAAFIEVRGFPP